MVKDHICTGKTCPFCRAEANLPPKPAPAPKRRAASRRIGQSDTHHNIEIQVLERVKELEQRAILNNLEHKEETVKSEVVERAALYDSLTNLYSARSFAKELDFEVKRAKRYKRPICLCLVVIDDLKELGSKYGAMTTDITLKAAASAIQNSIREIDIAARYTSDHFAILMPETTEAGAATVAERIRQRIKKQPVVHGRLNLSITASVGFTSFPVQAKDLVELKERATIAVDRAVAQGGDRVLRV
jgi:diguanylate cyclase (GGDEF)-like protein